MFYTHRKMFLESTAIFFFCSLAVMYPYGSAVETVSANVSVSCASYETPCTFGCCPYAQGVCCADGFECCQHGQTCIPFIGICIGLENENDKPSLISSKSTPIKSSIFSCPHGTTSCGQDKCCRYSSATCCSDGEHCCPQGYSCDIPNKRCIKDPYNQLDSKWNVNSGMTVTSPLKMINKSQHKTCPGGGRVCPTYMSCCIDDNAEWACCPNPSLPQLRYGGGQCCDTIFGHLCCPDLFPVCRFIGCFIA